MAKNFVGYMKQYMATEREVYDKLPLTDINAVMNVLEETRLAGGRVFVCGNGGSAATAAHFVCDFDKGVSHKLGHAEGERYDFICLNDNVPTMMAIANDMSYDDVFVLPLMNKMQSGDAVMGISGSGNSENVVRALKYANEHGGVSIALTAYDGGRMKKIAQHNIHIPINNMQIAEDLHMIIDHMMMWVLNQEKM